MEGRSLKVRWWRFNLLPRDYPGTPYYLPLWLDLTILAALVLDAWYRGDWFKPIFIGVAIIIIHCLAWLWFVLRPWIVDDPRVDPFGFGRPSYLYHHPDDA